MNEKPSFWQRIGLHEWFLSDEGTSALNSPQTMTPNDVYKYIIEKFKESIAELSFGDRVVFYHEFIISFNQDDYRLFMDNRKGIFGIIVHESVKKFYEILQEHASQGKTVEPSSSKWVFRFVSHPDYGPGDKGFIGKLLPGGGTQKEENLRVTFIPRQTGIAETFDVSQDVLKGFTFYSEGYYELPYINELEYDERSTTTTGNVNGFARFETIVPDKAFAGKKVEFFMKDEDILISGKDETREGSFIFKIPSDWVDSPHLRIKYNKKEDRFYLASFGEKTLLNEREVKRSDADKPEWTELPVNSRMLLNGIVGVNIFKS
ncbi:hypothetical protein [Pedobacter sp. SYSU D00535]|uniref:hypothetical protein n=1 Tax=Pedobacter sp. SYSU D00535 TaxID=2810308 RepID=UPI001A95BA15|nr:hypothetical protein [Pedobacter sp. SYSU D00535]